MLHICAGPLVPVIVSVADVVIITVKCDVVSRLWRLISVVDIWALDMCTGCSGGQSSGVRRVDIHRFVGVIGLVIESHVRGLMSWKRGRSSDIVWECRAYWSASVGGICSGECMVWRCWSGTMVLLVIVAVAVYHLGNDLLLLWSLQGSLG